MWHCRKKSKCHCPPKQLPVQTAAGSAFNSGVFNTDADRELAAAGKNNSTTPFYVCFPITPLNPLLALVTVHCRNIQASQKLRALAVCPHSFWDHLTFTSLPLTEFLSLGSRARAFAVQGGASSTQSLDFCLGPPWNWTFGTKIFLKSCPKVWYTKSQREHMGRLTWLRGRQSAGPAKQHNARAITHFTGKQLVAFSYATNWEELFLFTSVINR